MVKRYSWKSPLFVAFAIILMMLTWEHNRSEAAVVDGSIPQESIRLRILANSDSAEDQALKRRVRDVVVANMNGWVTKPLTIEEARELVRSRLPELEELVKHEITAEGYTYTSKVELGIVPFPAKMYGDKVYPAGDYEALRVTIGEGEGQNWWCVLFPALCFVDGATGEAVQKEPQAVPTNNSWTERMRAEQAAEQAAKAVKEARAREVRARAEQEKVEKARLEMEQQAQVQQAQQAQAQARQAQAKTTGSKTAGGKTVKASAKGNAVATAVKASAPAGAKGKVTTLGASTVNAGSVQATKVSTSAETKSSTLHQDDSLDLTWVDTAAVWGIYDASREASPETMQKADLTVKSKKQVRFYVWDKLSSLFD